MRRDKQHISFHASSILLVLVLATQLFASGAVPTTAPTVVSTTGSTSSPTSSYDNPLVEHKHERNCKALCEHCGCLGFYCGEECICECNNEDSDTECIHTMQANARTLNSPFEILIQGPSSNRFVRNAKQFEQKGELVARSAADAKSTRNRRSTITIYKPSMSGTKRAALSFNALETPSLGARKSELARHKRSVDHLEWFNDFANTLVRPSPLGTRAQKQREAKTVSFKRHVATTEPMPRAHREPWFFEQAAPRLTRPAPLNRRQQFSDDIQRFRNKNKTSARKVSKPVSIEEDSEPEAPKSKPEIRPFRDALQVVERIPRVLQDTVSHLAADNSGDVFSLNIMNDVLPKSVERKDNARVQRRPRFRTLDNDVVAAAITVTRAPVTTPAAPLAPRGLFLPWLRQRRLRRMRGEQ